MPKRAYLTRKLSQGGTRKTKCPLQKMHIYIQKRKYESEPNKPRNQTSSISTVKSNLLTMCNQATATAQVYSDQSENTRGKRPARGLHKVSCISTTRGSTPSVPSQFVFETVGVCPLPLVPPPIGLEHLALGPAIVVDLISELSLALGWNCLLYTSPSPRDS